MINSCSRTVFGSVKKHVVMTTKLKSWKSEAWEGFVPSNPTSVVFGNKLTISLINSIESEVRAFPKVL